MEFLFYDLKQGVSKELGSFWFSVTNSALMRGIRVKWFVFNRLCLNPHFISEVFQLFKLHEFVRFLLQLI